MADVFLLHDQMCFELSVRGTLVGLAAAASVGDAIARLPASSELVVDLSGVTVLDALSAVAIRRALIRRAGASAAIVAGDDLVRAPLVLAGIPALAALVITSGHAHQAVAGARRGHAAA